MATKFDKPMELLNAAPLPAAERERARLALFDLVADDKIDATTAPEFVEAWVKGYGVALAESYVLTGLELARFCEEIVPADLGPNLRAEILAVKVEPKLRYFRKLFGANSVTPAIRDSAERTSLQEFAPLLCTFAGVANDDEFTPLGKALIAESRDAIERVMGRIAENRP